MEKTGKGRFKEEFAREIRERTRKKEKVKINPLNVKGKYYINIDSCTCMGACELAAPKNIRIDKKSMTSYVFKQPET